MRIAQGGGSVDRLNASVLVSLWATAPLNLTAGIALAFPTSFVGRVLALPVPAHSLYAYLSGAMVALFGVAYLWMALRSKVDPPLLLLGACGKSFAAVISLWLYVSGDLPGLPAALISGDLAFAALWFAWLVRCRPVRNRCSLGESS